MKHIGFLFILPLVFLALIASCDINSPFTAVIESKIEAEKDAETEPETEEETVVAVTDIGISLTEATIVGLGTTLQLTAEVIPEDATNRMVHWESAVLDVASVDGEGLVTSVNEGLARITVTSDDGGFSATCDVTVQLVPGAKQLFSASGISFNMVYVPGGYIFPMGTTDSTDETVGNAYWIAETALTYGVWDAVIDWAHNNGYSTSITAQEGSNGTIGADPVNPMIPATNMQAARVYAFCNALTEWYNEQKGTAYTCVYTSGGSILKDYHSQPTIDLTATGFRLPSKFEWELAARWKGNDSSYGALERPVGSGLYWGPGAYASGATGVTTSEINIVAWHSEGETQPVKGKMQNLLGIYDMSGNTYEFTVSGTDALTQLNLKSSGHSTILTATAVGSGTDIPSSINPAYSFRLARTTD